MFKDYLITAKNQKSIVSLYTDKEYMDKFSLGYVQGVSNDYVLLASITPNGLYDGFTIKHYNNIYHVESKDKYGEKIHKLYVLKKQQHSHIELNTDNLIVDILQYAMTKCLVVSVELNDSGYNDLQGFVSDIQEGKIIIKQLDQYGKSDGESIALIEDISCVTCDSEEENAMKLLSENE